MSAERDFTDTTRCPLCGADNRCAVAAGRAIESCWCMSATIGPELLSRIPTEAQGRVCICEKCAKLASGK